MEPRFGHDFSQVRIHTDERAAETARAVNALAYTVGRDVVFGAGQYAPQTDEGRRLLAHELTHVVQQWKTFPLLQKNDDKGKSTQTSEWTELVIKAKAALNSNDKKNAENLYRQAILKAAMSVGVPEGLTKIDPRTQDIHIDFTLSNEAVPWSAGGAHAQTRGLEIPENQDNYWHWIYFGSTSLLETQVWTEGVIFHELIHVRYFRNVWNAQKQVHGNTPLDKGTWKYYLASIYSEARIKGPEELASDIPILAFLGKLKPHEQRQALRGMFVAYVKTSMYIPPQSENVVMTTAEARPKILNAYSSADRKLQERIGTELWMALIDIEPPRDRCISSLRELKPIAIAGYSDLTMRRHYDDFLRKLEIRFDDIINAL